MTSLYQKCVKRAYEHVYGRPSDAEITWVRERAYQVRTWANNREGAAIDRFGRELRRFPKSAAHYWANLLGLPLKEVTR